MKDFTLGIITDLLYDEPPVCTYSIAGEQRVAEKLRYSITKIENNKVTDKTGRQFIMKENIRHYISYVDSEPALRIYILMIYNILSYMRIIRLDIHGLNGYMQQ